MSITTDSLRAAAVPLQANLWRLVESQHVASTMKLVDNAAEQDLLEILLEQGKPPQAVSTRDFDYLLASPFRYPPYPGGSRFRAATDPGVFYGAETVRTACAELGYWRWRFLLDSPALTQLGPVAHTAFKAKVSTALAIDLRKPPLDAYTAQWTATRDYSATQSLARQSRDAGLQAIIYRSVRDPQPAWCVALLTPLAFAARKPEGATQSWWLRTTRSEILWRRDAQSFRFDPAEWQ
ncbi:RES family NAD+ phosphorylase [Viridibacterium curvum]|uniref:RES family NAD+ phosphorylase n=1 Tax=Viridibacterium curvum TaxID=1101404 RepID=A0ABP9QSS4_9RHOO